MKLTDGIKVIKNQGMKYGKFRYSAFLDSVTKKPVVLKECSNCTDNLSKLVESIEKVEDVDSTYILKDN